MKIQFLMMARLLYEKGYQEYVEAAKIVKRQYPDVEFLLLGGIDYEYPNAVPEKIVKRDHESHAINYLGFQSDVRGIIKKADCIVLPSYYNEGLSRVLMEGLAMSKPLITTNNPGCAETVEDGINGYICKPKDSQSLADCCIKFINMDKRQREEMGKNGRLKAIREFDIRDVIRVYESITQPYIVSNSYH